MDAMTASFLAGTTSSLVTMPAEHDDHAKELACDSEVRKFRLSIHEIPQKRVWCFDSPKDAPRPAGRLLIRNGCRPRPGMRNTNYTAVRLFPYHGVYILLLLLVVRAGPRSEERGKHIIGDERISAGAHTIVVSLHGQHARRELELLARRQR